MFVTTLCVGIVALTVFVAMENKRANKAEDALAEALDENARLCGDLNQAQIDLIHLEDVESEREDLVAQVQDLNKRVAGYVQQNIRRQSEPREAVSIRVSRGPHGVLTPASRN